MAADEVGDAVGNHSRFATSRAGQNQQRTFRVGDGFALLGI
jgi:hypothetical protein